MRDFIFLFSSNSLENQRGRATFSIALDMDKREDCCTTHLIDGDGTFNVAGIDNFVKEVNFAECGLSYAVVAIMGPQSSGKSTLLNHLFGTDFRVMDADEGRSQTTKGIWLAQCIGIEPCTLVMDLEGTDGRERGEDDTAFEKQSALFALAVSDIVLINMWCHDIGREQAANKPLLKIVFQVMMRLFSPRKTTLMFVIRDKTKTPLMKLESLLKEDIQKIWDSIPKPQAHKETPLSEFFNVEVVALSSYEYGEELFKEQVARLRQRFFHSTAPGGLAGDRRGVVPASAFSFTAQQIWEVIKENKDLDMKKQLEKAYQFTLELLRSEMLGRFKEAFDNALKEGKDFDAAARDCTEYFMSQFDDSATDARIGLANRDSSEVREMLRHDIDAHIAAVRAAKLSERTSIADEFNKVVEGFKTVADAALGAAVGTAAVTAAADVAGTAAAVATGSAVAAGAAAVAAGAAAAFATYAAVQGIRSLFG